MKLFNFFNKFKKQKVEIFPLIITFTKWWRIRIHKKLIHCNIPNSRDSPA